MRSVQRWRRAWLEAGQNGIRSRGPVSRPKLSLFFIYQDLPGLPMALRVSGRLTVLPTS
ncbi:hypothetical protein ACFWSF_35260 [Streptomyces sp. NPDC058611]|uniref:hypothetical protein n=1 Tax=unclassified Streptomyces TaxID=2593676 RepID=UPI0036569029